MRQGAISRELLRDRNRVIGAAGELPQRAVEKAQCAAEILPPDVMVSRSKLDEPLKEDSALTARAEPRLFPFLVCVPEVTGVEIGDAGAKRSDEVRVVYRRFGRR